MLCDEPNYRLVVLSLNDSESELSPGSTDLRSLRFEIQSQSLADVAHKCLQTDPQEHKHHEPLYVFTYCELSHVKLEPLGALSSHCSQLKITNSVHIRRASSNFELVKLGE